MATFGTRLRVEREQRGITLDQISRSTKIGTRFLQALEQDRFDQLPGGIFNKGFIRAYARFLGLDEEQAVSDYLTATSPGDPSPAVPETVMPVEADGERAGSLPWGTFATLLLVIALSFAVWGFYTREPATGVKPAVAPAPSSSSTDSISPPAAVAPSDSQVPSSEPRTAPQEMPSDSGSHPAPSAPSISNDSFAPAQSQPESPSTKAPVSAASLVQASFAVRIKAHQDAWVLITVDGRKLSEETLIPGGEKLVKAANQVVVRTGNSGALDFEFNGQKVPTQGALGEVKTLEFGPSGLEVTVSKPPTAQTP